MKRVLLFSLMSLFCILLHAQEVVMDGVTFSSDKKTLIKYPKDKTDLEYTIPEGTEIIGKKAFENTQLSKLTLSTTLTHIKDSAFYQSWYLTVIITGKFPILERYVFIEDDHGLDLQISDDNPYCKYIDESICSKDGKTLHKVRRYHINRISDNIEIIDRFALQHCYVLEGELYIPESVKLIKEQAFDNLREISITRSDDNSRGFIREYNCLAPIPPTLEGTVFEKGNVGNSYLFVPKESVELYKAASQWNNFEDIIGIIIHGIEDNATSDLKISRYGSTIQLVAQKPLGIIHMISLNGTITYEKSFAEEDITTYSITTFDSFTGLLQVIYKDGGRYTMKLNY